MFFKIGEYAEERDSQYELYQAVDAGRFDKVCQNYKLITGDVVNVLVPYDIEEFDRLSQIVQKREFMTIEDIRHWVAQARDYAVGVFRPAHDSFKWQALAPVQFGAVFKYDTRNADWFICLPEAEYNDLCGLKLPENFVGIC